MHTVIVVGGGFCCLHVYCSVMRSAVVCQVS
jgi:hypothetical protein